jgi:competence protein ComEA
MPWSPPAARVLLAGAAALFVAALLAVPAGRRPLETPVADDPRLELRLDLNAASPAELEALPGVGPALAARIAAHRAARGPFRSVDDLREVPGVGAKVVAALRPFVVVGAR